MSEQDFPMPSGNTNSEAVSVPQVDIGRRGVVKSLGAATAIYALAKVADSLPVSFENVLSESKIAAKVSERLKKSFRYLFGDHVLHEGLPKTFINGEIRQTSLYTDGNENLSAYPEQSTYLNNGVEILSRERKAKHLQAIRETKVVAATDGQMYYPDSYLQLDAAGKLKADETAQLVAERGNAVLSILTLGTALRELPDMVNLPAVKMGRRAFLRLGGLATGAVIFPKMLGEWVRKLDFTDLSSLPPIWQEMAGKILPFNEEMKARNFAMANDTLALGNVCHSLNSHVSERVFMSGGGHKQGILELMDKDPVQMQVEFGQFVGEKMHAFAQLYDRCSDDLSRQDVVFGALGFLGIYGPTKLRVNHGETVKDEKIKVGELDRPGTLYYARKEKQTEGASIDSSFKLVFDRLVKLQQDFRAEPGSLQFLHTLLNQLCLNLAEDTTYFVNGNKQFEVGFPVEFSEKQAHYAFGKWRIFFAQGFLTAVKQVDENGKIKDVFARGS